MGKPCDRGPCLNAATKHGWKIVNASFCDHHAHTEKNYGFRPSIREVVDFFADPAPEKSPNREFAENAVQCLIALAIYAVGIVSGCVIFASWFV